MTELLAPGVYTIETSFRARSIQGVGTSTTGFVGLARSGPVGGPPQLITSFPEFERVYGGLSDLDTDGLGDGALKTNFAAHAVRSFFNEMGARVYFSRTFTPIDEANDTGKASALLRDDGASSLRFTSRFPGSASNGSLDVSEAVTQVTPQVIENAGVGAMIRSKGGADSSASLVASAAPGIVASGSELSIAVDGNAAVPITFTATAATVSGSAVANPVDVAANTNIVITVDGLRQIIPITEGVGRTMRQVRNSVRATLQKAVCDEAGGVLTFTSAVAGRDIAITVEANPFGFDADVTVSGSGLRRLDKVSAGDINTLLADAGVNTVTASTTGAGGQLVLTSGSAGDASAIDISGTDAGVRTALGFDTETANGQTQAAIAFYIRQSADKAGWQRYVRNDGTGRWDVDGALVDPTSQVTTEGDSSTAAFLVAVTMSYTNADGILVAYENMSLVDGHARYLGARMKKLSDIDITNGAQEPVSDPLVMEEDGLNAVDMHEALFAIGTTDGDGVKSASHAMTGGNDGVLPALGEWEKALEELNRYDDISIVAAPGSSAYSLVGQSMRKSLGIHASQSGFRIAVIDPPLGETLDSLRNTRGEIDNSYAAFYAPWIRIANPLARPGNEAISRDLLVPPSGHVCGIYARNDQLRGVHKTPANEVIRSSIGFERDYNQAQQGVLNPLGINCLRTLKGWGNRVYGGRLATSDREVLYVSDRRYLNFIKRSIYESMQWAVFEPNGPDLWANVREAVSSFLYNQWFNGALFGNTPDEAYFVVCDGSVMTQADLDNGRMVCEIGLAILKPAEFVVFSIGQKTADMRR